MIKNINNNNNNETNSNLSEKLVKYLKKIFNQFQVGDPLNMS